MCPPLPPSRGVTVRMHTLPLQCECIAAIWIPASCPLTEWMGINGYSWSVHAIPLVMCEHDIYEIVNWKLEHINITVLYIVRYMESTSSDRIGNYLFSREFILDMGVVPCRVLFYLIPCVYCISRRKELTEKTEFLFTEYSRGCVPCRAVP